MNKALLSLIVILSLFFTIIPHTASAAAIIKRPMLIVVTSFFDSVTMLSEKDVATVVFGSKRFRGSVADFYFDQSMGRMIITSANEGWGKKNDGIISVTLGEESPREFTKDPFIDTNRLARKALIASDSFVNFREFDKDSNGKITNDELTIAIFAVSVSFRAHYASLLNGVVLDGVVIGSNASPLSNEGLVLMPAFDMDPSALISVMKHEIGHSLGLPDLYGENNPLPGQSLSLMGTGNELDAWSRQRLGWIDVREVSLGEYTIKAKMEALVVKTTVGYLIIENRLSRGVVIYSYYPRDNYPDGYQPISVCDNRYWDDELWNDGWCVFANSASIIQSVSRRGISSSVLFDHPNNVNAHGLSITVLDPAGDVMRIKIEEVYSSSSEKG